MDHVAERHPGNRNAVATAAPAVDPETVLRESRQQFVSTFASQCDGILTRADQLVAAPDSGADAIGWLHRIAGLGGTVGFPTVSTKAAELEDAFRAGALTAQQLRDGIAAMRTAFTEDVTGPVIPAAAPLSHGPTLTVMVVEDEVVQRKILCAQLSQAGHSPVAVACGEDVLAEAHASKPDVILLDVDLPGIDGYTVCRMLKADPALAGIPVAFLSAHGTVDARLTGLSHGADDFLTKPIDPRELTLRLQLLSKRKQHADGPGAFSVLTYDAFCELAYRAIQHDRCALALIRTPVGKASDVATFTRDEIRRRDLCGEYDRSHVVVLLPDTGAAAGRERIGSIVEKCRADGIDGVYAGVAAASVAGGRTLEELVEEADEALAIARYENQAAAVRPDGPRRDAPVQGQVIKPLVLVGDDDPDVIRIVDSHLAAGGYRRVLAFDGSRTLEEVRAQKPDVLVLDLMMPRMTGFDVLAGIRDMAESRPRVIVLSARGREEDVIRAFSLGADDFIAKPFNPQELMARIARLLK
jgi:DNA-binding response OmpR family regulator